jgi:uncharacterized protein YodC (DUF2158 family)
MTFEVGDTVRFKRDGGVMMIGTVTSVKGREPYRGIGVRGAGASENFLIPERHLYPSSTQKL